MTSSDLRAPRLRVRIFTPGRGAALRRPPDARHGVGDPRAPAERAVPRSLDARARRRAACPWPSRPEAGGGEIAWLTAPPVKLGRRSSPTRIAPALGLARSGHRARPPGAASVLAGIEFVHVPLASLAAVAQARLDPAAFAPLAAEGFQTHVYLFAREAEAPGTTCTRACCFDAPGRRARRPGHGQRHGLPRRLPARARPPRRPLRAAHRAGRRDGPALAAAAGGDAGTAAAAKIRVGGRVLESARGELL